MINNNHFFFKIKVVNKLIIHKNLAFFSKIKIKYKQKLKHISKEPIKLIFKSQI